MDIVTHLTLAGCSVVLGSREGQRNVLRKSTESLEGLRFSHIDKHGWRDAAGWQATRVACWPPQDTG